MSESRELQSAAVAEYSRPSAPQSTRTASCITSLHAQIQQQQQQHSAGGPLGVV